MRGALFLTGRDEGSVVVVAYLQHLSFFQASRHVPKPVLLGGWELPVALRPARDQPDLLHLPLQPGAVVAARVRAELRPGRAGADLLLSRSRKGCCSHPDRLPPGGELSGDGVGGSSQIAYWARTAWPASCGSPRRISTGR